MKSARKVPSWVSSAYSNLAPGPRKIKRVYEEIEDRAMGLEETQNQIFDSIQAGRGYFLGRPGGTESVGLDHFLKSRLVISERQFTRPYPKFFRNHAQPFSGIVADTGADWDFFGYVYLKAALSASLFAYGEFAPGALGLARLRAQVGLPVTNIEKLEPWLALKADLAPWTHALQGKRVLVVHPFCKTISSQHERLASVDGVNIIMPEFELLTIRPPVTVAEFGLNSGNSWEDSLRSLTLEVEKTSFDVALIAAGAYGLPLAESIADMGRPAIHLGGSLQLLFGISGQRWRSRPIFAPFMGDGWVEAFEEDRFPGLTGIEGGSYT